MIRTNDNSFFEYIENYLEDKNAQMLFDTLNSNIDWSPQKMKIYNKVILTPRLIHWFSHHDYPFADLPANPVPEYLNLIIKGVTRYVNNRYKTNMKYDSVLINKYRNGNDYIGWHSDSEAKKGTIVAMLSLGQMRTFGLRKKDDQDDGLGYIEYNLKPGSLFIMGGDSQKHWKHSLLKSKGSDRERISLIFRMYR